MAAFDARDRTFVRASGTMLTDANGNEVFDAISSVWTTIHGHGHPAIVEAIARQAATLDHATALGATNPVADELAERLCALTGMHRAFFCSDGASAVEAALKIALKFWRNNGRPERTRIARLTDAYHGDTIGAMSVSGVGRFKDDFAAVCFESLPYDALAGVLDRDDIAAIIIEPSVQAAAGMRLVPAAAYEPLRAPLEPLLIVDEIATGFGRTGTMFAFDPLGLKPDLVCLGKGLSGGTLALSATLVSERVFDAFLGEAQSNRHFFHGHSFAGNPIACAAALASLDLFDRDGTLEQVAAVGAALDGIFDGVRAHAAVREVRRKGLMCAIELERCAPVGTASAVAGRLYERGYFTRPLGEAVQFVPPLCTSAAQCAAFAGALLSILDE